MHRMVKQYRAGLRVAEDEALLASGLDRDGQPAGFAVEGGDRYAPLVPATIAGLAPSSKTDCRRSISGLLDGKADQDTVLLKHDAFSIGGREAEMEAKALSESPFNARSVTKTRADQSETWLDAG